MFCGLVVDTDWNHYSGRLCVNVGAVLADFAVGDLLVFGELGGAVWLE